MTVEIRNSRSWQIEDSLRAVDRDAHARFEACRRKQVMAFETSY
jgi:hypothetical protein